MKQGRASILLIAAMLAAGGIVALRAQDATITLERRQCLGACPVYRVSVFADGSVTYEGHDHVRVKGMAHGRIAPEVVSRLLSEFDRIGYWELRDEYRFIRNPDGTSLQITDLPTTITSLSIAGRSKSVLNYLGAPAALRDLERTIDRVAGVKHWVSLDVSAVLQLSEEGWDIRTPQAVDLAVQAVTDYDSRVVAALLERGLDANADAPRFLLAARSAPMIELLIGWGADVNASTHTGVAGITPLMHAARSGRFEAVQAFLKAGANVNVIDASGQTALMDAAIGGNPDAVRALLRAGARSDVRNFQGYTALDFARSAVQDERVNKEYRERMRAAGFSEPRPDFGAVVDMLSIPTK